MAFFTVKELAEKFGVPPATIRWHLLFLRQLRKRPPTPDQVRVGAHGRRAYRADYAALLQRP